MNNSNQIDGTGDTQGNTNHSSLIPIGACYFDIAHEQIFDKYQSYLHLRPKSVSVLIALYQNKNRVMTKKQLMAAVWGEAAVTEGSLVQCVRDLRNCLNDHTKNIIVTVPKRGYMLNLHS